MRFDRGRAFDDELPQRLAQLQPRRRTRLVRERHDAAEIRYLVEQRAVRLGSLRPRGEVHRLGPVEDEVAPEVVGEERHHGRKHAQRLHERIPERAQCSLVTVPETPTGATDVPVREIVDVRLVERDHLVREIALVRRGRVGDERARAFDEPAVERLELAGRLELRPRRAEAVDVRV